MIREKEAEVAVVVVVMARDARIRRSPWTDGFEGASVYLKDIALSQSTWKNTFGSFGLLLPCYRCCCCCCCCRRRRRRTRVPLLLTMNDLRSSLSRPLEFEIDGTEGRRDGLLLLLLLWSIKGPARYLNR